MHHCIVYIVTPKLWLIPIEDTTVIIGVPSIEILNHSNQFPLFSASFYKKYLRVCDDSTL
jgi:hypothetical protein